MIAPSMWKAHMTLHAQNILPGDIPLEWLQDQDSFICLQCHQIVASSRLSSHSDKCSGSNRGPRSSGVSVASTTTAPGQVTSVGSAPETSLPSFEAVCHLLCATIRHIPQKARFSFARVLSDSLHSVCVSNSEEAWLKLFMHLFGVVINTSLVQLRNFADCDQMGPMAYRCWRGSKKTNGKMSLYYG